jgi:hypothetical protein
VSNRFSSGKNSIGECDRCGFRFKLKELRSESVKGRTINNLVCSQCWSADHPQLRTGEFPVNDPQGVRNPRPDRSYVVSGLLTSGYSGGGSRVFQWGWNPVGGAGGFDAVLTPNNLAMVVEIGTVTVVTT